MRLVESTDTDISRLKEMWYALALDMEQYSELNTLRFNSVEEVPSDAFITQNKSDDPTDYLITVDNTVVGFVTIRLGKNPSFDKSDYLEILNLYIKEMHQGSGFGSEALELLKEKAEDEGMDFIKVSFESNNTGAEQFYEKNDFIPKQKTFVHQVSDD